MLRDVITGHGDVPLAVRAMKAGAIDFIEKPFASQAILDCLAAAFARLATPAGQDPGAGAAASKLDLLSPRERAVLEGLLEGLPNKSIAYDLEISPRTAEIHRAAGHGQDGSAQPFRANPSCFDCRRSAQAPLIPCGGPFLTSLNGSSATGLEREPTGVSSRRRESSVASDCACRRPLRSWLLAARPQPRPALLR